MNKLNKYQWRAIYLSLVALGVIFYIYKDTQYRRANCNKIYYTQKENICVNYETRPVMVGKTIVLQNYCTKYKDTLVRRYRYECPN